MGSWKSSQSRITFIDHQPFKLPIIACYLRNQFYYKFDLNNNLTLTPTTRVSTSITTLFVVLFWVPQNRKKRLSGV